MKDKVSVVIAAKNEAPRIAGVLDIVCNHPLVSEVIVMCNGSVDNTTEVAKRYEKAIVHDEIKAQGKTLSIKKGLEFVTNEVVVLLDADLMGMTQKNVTDLAQPVLDGKVDFTLSMRGNSLRIYKLFGIDFLSGERAMKTELLKDPTIWSRPHLSYGLEVLMNNSLLTRKKRFITVDLPNLHHPTKNQKEEFWYGTFADAAMVFNIFLAFPFYRVGWQLFKMSYLNKKYHKEVAVASLNAEVADAE